MAFECTKCRGPLRWNKTWVDDPLYTGPFGHAPTDLCFDCWSEMTPDQRKVSRKQSVAQALVGGYTQVESAGIAGVCVRTVGYWVAAWKKKSKLPILIAENGPSRVRTLQKHQKGDFLAGFTST